MDTNNSQSNDFGASLPLPENDQAASSPPQGDQQAAADLIRKKVQSAYTNEPDATEEVEDLTQLEGSLDRSKHQQFIYELTSSGRALEDIQTAWHEYYAALPDLEKHRVWQEFYSAHSQASNYRAAVPTMAPIKEKPPETPQPKLSRRAEIAANHPSMLDEVRANAVDTLKSLRRGSPRQHLQSLLFGLGVGCMVLLIFLFGLFNERVIAPFVQPSRNVSGTPIIGSTVAVGDSAEVIIPKINVEVPVVYGVDTINDDAIETALESGVVHYADTAMPGQNGNLVIVGHSSNNIFNKGKYKFAFVLLSRLENGDTFYIQKDGKRYTYQVYKKQIVPPSDTSVLGLADKPATATLITCDPPGTSTNRLIVVGEQISPEVSSNIASSSQNTLATSTQSVPGNSTSLWSRLWHSL